MNLEEKTVFEQSVAGRRGVTWDLSRPFNPPDLFPKELIREKAPSLPELCEADISRHFTRLSTHNYSKDLGLYPLGSCTMKYNPKIANQISCLLGFSATHPYQPEETVQGNLKLLWELEHALCEISGMDAVSLWPAAGAHGELTGMLIIHAYHRTNGRQRKKILIPDSAHGTNPASAAICGYESVEIKSNSEGLIDPKDVEKAMDEDVAAMMITNPNTLGIFEEQIREIAKIVHDKDGLLYCDGANLNALMGMVKLGKEGIDIMHFNLHKTFATPHGGGGPGSGPVGVVEKLKQFLPLPRIIKSGEKFKLQYTEQHSIGMVKTFFGNFAVLVRAYTYIKGLGADGLKKATELAVLNANYIKARLKGHYHLPYSKNSLHECVFSDQLQNKNGVKTLDIAKRLMDYGFHPPTIYFPLIVHGSLMIEPTETESKALLDEFCSAMIKIAKESEENPDLVKGAPYNTFRSRLDEALAARKPKLKE